MKRIIILICCLFVLHLTSSAELTSASASSEQKKSTQSGNATPKIHAESLNIFPVLGDRYKRHKDCRLTMMDNISIGNSVPCNYRDLEVRQNKQLVDEIRELVEKDIAQIGGATRTYDGSSGNSFSIMRPNLNLVYEEGINGDWCKLTLIWAI